MISAGEILSSSSLDSAGQAILLLLPVVALLCLASLSGRALFLLITTGLLTTKHEDGQEMFSSPKSLPDPPTRFSPAKSSYQTLSDGERSYFPQTYYISSSFVRIYTHGEGSMMRLSVFIVEFYLGQTETEEMDKSALSPVDSGII